MTSSLIVELLLATIAAVIGISSYLLARRANKEQVQMVRAQSEAATAAVDAGAYARAREIYEGALTTLREELGSTRKDVYDLRASNTALAKELDDVQKELTEAIKSNRSLQRSNEELKREVHLLREELAQVRGTGQ